MQSAPVGPGLMRLGALSATPAFSVTLRNATPGHVTITKAQTLLFGFLFLFFFLIRCVWSRSTAKEPIRLSARQPGSRSSPVGRFASQLKRRRLQSQGATKAAWGDPSRAVGRLRSATVAAARGHHRRPKPFHSTPSRLWHQLRSNSAEQM